MRHSVRQGAPTLWTNLWSFVLTLVSGKAFTSSIAGRVRSAPRPWVWGKARTETSQASNRARAKTGEATYLLLALWVGVASGLYFVLRYRGHWGEVDSAIFTQMVGSLEDWRRIKYPNSYSHGYGYSVWAASLGMVWNVPVAQLQRWVTPLIGNVFMATFGYAAFRRWLGSSRLGLLAATSLFLVPELIFTISRGNHEKLTATLTLLASLSFLRSFQLSKDPRKWQVTAGWVIVHYLLIFTLVSLNAFFGSMFFYASFISYSAASVALWFFPKARRELRPTMRRFALMVATSMMVMFIVQWYIYPHESESQRILASIISGFGAVRETGETQSDPYALVRNDWVSRRAYNIVSSFRFVLLGISFVTWIALLIRALTRLRKTPVERLFLLTLYGSFGLLLAIGVAIDFLGLSAGSNWQVRIYTYFSSFAVPLFVLGAFGLREFLSRLPLYIEAGARKIVFVLSRPVGRQRQTDDIPSQHVAVPDQAKLSIAQRSQNSLTRKVVTHVFALIVVGFVGCSLLKSTLDPLVSNRWIAYKVTETHAIDFWFNHRGDDTLNVGNNMRLYFGYVMQYGWRAGTRSALETGFTPRAPHLIRSTANAANAVAWNTPVPAALLDDAIYDNGETQIVHRIPRTPFQQ
ncbi:MAG: hypothetical protein AAF267_16315 [Deinococcota bacterium]